MFSWIIKLFVKDYTNTKSAYVQLAYINVVSWISIVLNIMLSLVKIGLGLYYNTISIMSDGLDSFSNVLSSFVLILAYRFLSRKESLENPFGLGRMVYIANFFIALILAFTGLEMIIISTKHLIYSETIPTFNIAILTTVFVSMLINEWSARFCFYVSKIIHSDVMYTEGLHRRWDNLLSLTVIFAWLASLYNIIWVDTCIGIFFGFLIIKSAYSISKDNIKELLGTAAPEELVKKISDLANTVPGVINIHEIVVHNYGKKRMVSAHVEIDENLNLREAHLICDKVEDLLYEKLNIHTTTHADPINLKEPATKVIIAYKAKILEDEYLQSIILDIEHIYVGEDYSNPQRAFVSLDIFLLRQISDKEKNNIQEILHTKISTLIKKDIRLKVRLRPFFGTRAR